MRESRYWALFMLAAALLIVLLSVHMAMLHLGQVLAWIGIDVEGAMEYSSVMTRAKNISWLTLYVALLLAGVYHGLYGLRSVLLELTGSENGSRTITSGVVVLGLAAVILGLYVLVQSFIMPVGGI